MDKNENQYYFEGADPTDLSQIESHYIKKLSDETNNIKENTVYVSPKLDGYRAILYHNIKYHTSRTRRPPVYDTESCFMITRRGHRYEVDINLLVMPAYYLHKPFIFDIEIVENVDNYNSYYIMDILHVNQESLFNTSFEYRLQKLNEFTEFNLKVDPQPCRYHFKTVPYKLYNPAMRMKDITGLVSQKTDGVVFCFGKDWVRQSRLRYKVEDTIDFQILPMEGSRDSVGLGVLINVQPQKGPSRIMNRSRIPLRSKQRIELFAPHGRPQVVECKKDELQINGIYEFKYNLKQQKFECIRRRFDKQKPNKLFVANFIFNEIIKKKHLINPFQEDQKEEEEKEDDSDSSPESEQSSRPESM